MTDIDVHWVGQNHVCSVNTCLFFCSSNGYFRCFLLEHHIFHDYFGHHFSQCFFITSIILNFKKKIHNNQFIQMVLLFWSLTSSCSFAVILAAKLWKKLPYHRKKEPEQKMISFIRLVSISFLLLTMQTLFAGGHSVKSPMIKYIHE